MSHVESCMCHIRCTDVDIIRTDVDVSSTDVDSSPADWARLTKTLTVNIFRSVTLFDEPFTSLEILRRALHDDVGFTKF
jgi:hypothetical protein